MSYADQADMERNFGEDAVIQLCDPKRTGQLDPVTLAGALASADAEIDSRIGARFATPLPPHLVGLHLRNMACALARHYLTGNGALLTDDIIEGRKNAVSWLKDVASGAAPLVGGEATAKSNNLARVAPARPATGNWS